MRISMKYNELMNTLGYVSSILADKSVEDKLKNVIFMVDPNTIKIVGYSAYIFSRTTVEGEIEDVPEIGWKFQVKASNLMKVLSSFSSLSKTFVDHLEFSDDGVRIRLDVFEEPMEGESERFRQTSSFKLENVPILSKVESEIMMEYPEGDDMISSQDLGMYIESLFPLMNNDSVGKMDSKLNFAEDYVFVASSQLSSYMKNRLPDAFKEITLSYSSVSFLKKVVDNFDDLGVCKTDKYLCVQTESTDAFMRYQNIKVKYKSYLKNYKKEKGIVVDRQYFKDVLNRMSNVDINGVATIGNGDEMEVVNSVYSQPLPLLNRKGDVSGISFNMVVSFFEKAIIGRDDLFKSEVFLYFVNTSRGYMIFMQDKTDSWLSHFAVTRA